MRIAIFAAVLAVFSAPVQAQSVSAASCEQLAASLKLPNTTVSSAKLVPAGKFVQPGGGAGAPRAAASLPAFCRVALTIKPTSDSDIKSEVWLPASGWNGKFLAVGNGAWGGSIQYGALGEGLQRGYAVASTDTGHTGADASFAVGHPEKLIDFGYRSVHETAVQGKATTAALYGTAPRFSYFNGCSGGGRHVVHGSAALSAGLRRHHRRRARLRPHARRVPVAARGAGDSQGSRELHPGDEVSGDSPRGGERVRRD